MFCEDGLFVDCDGLLLDCDGLLFDSGLLADWFDLLDELLDGLETLSLLPLFELGREADERLALLLLFTPSLL